MRKYLFWMVAAVMLLLPAGLAAESAVPRIKSVTPRVATSGDILKLSGENLSQAAVAALYLTDGKNDVPVKMLSQTADSITFKVPAEAKTGKMALMVLTKSDPPKLLEEPVKVTIQ